MVKNRVRFAAAVMAALVLGAPGVCAAETGVEVAGQVSLPRRGMAREAVAWLEGEKKGTPLAHALVDQRDKAFSPHVSVITRGTTVQFPNNDTVFHNVFAYFHVAKLDLGTYPRGTTRKYTFPKCGVVSLLCNVHSDMSAYIVIVDTPYYTITDRQGRFTLHGVPPGNYTLHVWHESGAELTQPVVVKAGDAAWNLALKRK